MRFIFSSAISGSQANMTSFRHCSATVERERKYWAEGRQLRTGSSHFNAEERHLT